MVGVHDGRDNRGRAVLGSPARIRSTDGRDANDEHANTNFNRAAVKVHGRSIRLTGRAVTSGEAERMIAAGTLKPVVWGPASSLWGRLLNAHVRKEWVPLDNPSIVQSPQVIAMPERTARKLGWPRRSIGWKDIPRLAAWGEFRFAHPNPTTSTSGLSTLVAEYYAVTGKIAFTGELGPSCPTVSSWLIPR